MANTQQVEVLRRLAANALKLGEPGKAAAHFQEAIDLFMADSAALGTAHSGGLVTEYCAFAELHPELASPDSVMSLLEAFCTLGERENIDPNWLIQFLLIRAHKAGDITPELKLSALERLINYFRAHDDLAYTPVIGEQFIQYADLLFNAGRYTEVEQVLNEGLALSKGQRSPSAT